MGDETKHKGTTKGDGGMAFYDCYGNEELKGNERSGNEELREENGCRGSLHVKLHYVRTKFATPIVHTIDNFKNYDIFSTYT